MGKNKFLLEVKGKDFVLSFKGEGNAVSAKKELSKAFGGLPVRVITSESADPVDMHGSN